MRERCRQQPEAVMSAWVTGAIIGGVAGGVGVFLLLLVIALLMPARKCPDCGEPFPKFRKPSRTKQALWGGATCSHCGCEVDGRGRKVKL